VKRRLHEQFERVQREAQERRGELEGEFDLVEKTVHGQLVTVKVYRRPVHGAGALPHPGLGGNNQAFRRRGPRRPM
jgi:hypothetical protein